MARLRGIEAQEAGWLTRLVYWIVRRKMAKLTGRSNLIEPIKILAHHPRLLRAQGRMEMAQDRANSVPIKLKALVSIKAATMIGCPF